MNRFNRIRHHVDIKDVKKRHLEETAAKKLEKKRLKEEVEQIKAEYEKQKSDWRGELDLKESDWTPIDSPITNSTSQTFTYSVPNFETGEPNTFTVSGLGGVESLPSSVKVDFGFGESPPGGVNPPSYNQLALAGYAKPLLMKRRDTEEVNPRLDASQEFAQKVGADVMMNARVKTDEEKPDFVFGRDDPTMPGVMKDPEEIKMNEKLYKFQEIYQKTVERNNKITGDHEKNVLAPYVNKLLSPLKLKKVEGLSPKLQLYKNRQVSNEAGDIIVMIDSNSDKVTFTKYTLINGRWSSSEKSFDQPRLRSLPTMPKFLQDWQSQGIDPSFAIPRSDGAILAKAGKVESAFNLVNYYIDNHVKTMAGMDPSRKDIRHDVTDLYSNETLDILRKGMDELKPKIDEKIKLGKKVNQSKESLQKEIRDLVDNYFAHGGAGKSSRDIFNSLGNALGFNLDTYMETGNYQFDSTYLFTSTYDMGIRGKLSFLSGAAQKYVSGQLNGETAMAVQNPMQFQVNVESGKQYAPLVKAEPSKAVKKIKSMTKTKRQSLSLDEPIVRRKKES